MILVLVPPSFVVQLECRVVFHYSVDCHMCRNNISYLCFKQCSITLIPWTTSFPFTTKVHSVAVEVNTLFGFLSCDARTENKFLDIFGTYQTSFKTSSWLSCVTMRISPDPEATKASLPAALTLERPMYYFWYILVLRSLPFHFAIDHYPLPTFHYFVLIVCCAKMTEIARFVLELWIYLERPMYHFWYIMYFIKIIASRCFFVRLFMYFRAYL